MALMTARALERQAQERALHAALRAWYLTPGVQGDLRRAENQAVQLALEVLRQRTAKTTS